MVKRILISVLFFFVAQVALFLLVSNSFPNKMEMYLYNLHDSKPEMMYGDLYGKKILFQNEIRLIQGFNRKEYSFDILNTLIELENGTIAAYLSNTVELDSIMITSDAYRIIGRNVFARNTGFLIRKDSTMKLADKSNSLIYRYFGWLQEVLRGNFGKTFDNSEDVSEEIGEKLPKTLILVLYSIILNTIISIVLAYFVIIFCRKGSSFVENSMELLSSIPDFLIAFLLIFIFHFKFDLLIDYKPFFREFSVYHPFSKTLYYFLFPALTIALSNGNTSFLFKNLLEKMESIKSGVFFKISQANGMKKRYLYFVFIFKEILPITFSFISQKVPLIIGSSIIVDWVFSIDGIGYLMITNFRDKDIGCIMIIFSILYLMSIFLNLVTEIISRMLKPMEMKDYV